jgi:nucleoside-diphosphate-sugar epimerase|tara:strand:+ start:3161 stop:3916 length:756 start_codon:yes stop_codon:yes gene_type:complete
VNILLTGHKGFIGSSLLKALELNHIVTGIDLKDGVDLLTCDLPNIKFDLIIHLAGRSGVRESINDPAAYWANNVEASRRLFERYSETRIMYASSSSAYEPDLNPYAASKYVLEELASRYPNTLGMRFHTVYSNTPRKDMFFDKLFNNKLEYVTRHHRDFVHLYDLIDAINILIEADYVKGVLDIGSGVPVRIQDFAPKLPVRLNTPTERQWTCANLEKMKALGFKPKYSIEKYLTTANKGNIINIFNGETV